MSLESILFNIGASKGDKKRDSLIPFPTGVTQLCNVSYGPHGKANKMDIYYPDGETNCPVIVSIHGGGYVYGDKELYKRYCMDLARRGFAVVNFNYRLAPRWKFPAPLEDTNNVLLWLQENSERYPVDLSRLFMVGDSAGAQLVSQYAAMLTNPDYFALFGFHAPGAEICLRAVGLNCGVYDMKTLAANKRQGLSLDYLGRKISSDDPRLSVLENITAAFPPAHITTACHDFLRANAQPMAKRLEGKGVEAVCKCYGTEKDTHIAHVFHVNIILPEAISCNDEQCDFFRAHM